MRNWIHLKDLQRAVQSRSHFFLANAEPDYIMNWQSALDVLDVNRDKINMIDTLGGVCTEYRPHPYLMSLVDTINETVGKDHDVTAHLYFSFTKDQKTNGKHRDTANVFFIGLIGNTQFKIYGEDGRYKSYRVGPGDLIYIPRGIDHDTTPMGPRIGLSIGIEA